MALPNVNLNFVAVELTKEEGLKKQVSIAQIKEIIKKYNEHFTLEAIISIWNKCNK